jgi:hypothetical protein
MIKTVCTIFSLFQISTSGLIVAAEPERFSVWEMQHSLVIPTQICGHNCSFCKTNILHFASKRSNSWWLIAKFWNNFHFLNSSFVIFHHSDISRKRGWKNSDQDVFRAHFQTLRGNTMFLFVRRLIRSSPCQTSFHQRLHSFFLSSSGSIGWCKRWL